MWNIVGAFILVFFRLPVGVEPSFLRQPVSKSALKGDFATFECQINNVVQPFYFWLKGGSNITKGIVSLSGSLSRLQLSSVTFSDSGNYSCIAVNNQTGKTWKSSTGILYVQGKPDIEEPPDVISTVVGMTALFHCVAVGSPHPSITWTNSSGSAIITSVKFNIFINGSLRINQLQKSDSGLYICEAQNAFGKTTASATLQVNDPPVLPSFTTHPVNQTAIEGGRVTFYCEATGNPPPRITWSKAEGQISADRIEEPSLGSLRIIRVQLEDDGIYICTAQNSKGSVTTQASLQIEGYPRITIGPSDKVATENTSVQFPCVIEGDPVPHAKWTLPNGTMYNSTSHSSGLIRVLANNSLIIGMVKGEHAGRYTCTAINKVGKRLVSATLYVLTMPRFYSPLNNMTRNTGSRLTVECGVHATPPPEYHWFFNGSVISRDRRLNLSSLSTSYQGFYMCLANNSLGSVHGAFYLRIQVLPQFVVAPGNQTVVKGLTASFPCSARGDPKPSINWYRSGDLISSDSQHSIQSNGSLIVKEVTHNHTGWYTCHATNGAGYVKERAYLLVADLPVFTTKPSNITVNDGSTVTLYCRTHGLDEPHITWLIRDNGNVFRNVSNRAAVDPIGDLKYTTVKPQDRGLHICRACNAAGCRSAMAFLGVLFAPSFSVPPKSVAVLRGEDAVLQCKPESSPPAVITWSGPNNQLLPGTEYQYVVHNVQPRDVGVYTCTAENSLGSSDATVQLSIGTKAKIRDFAKTSSSQSNIIVQCIVDGIPSPLVTWYLQNTLLPNKGLFPKFDVTPDNNLYVPAWSLSNNSFVCNCTNPHASVSKLARVPDAPSEVIIKSVLETAVEVFWQLLNPQDLVLEYMLELQSRDGVWRRVNNSIKTTSALVDNLTSFTVYTFRVRAMNGLGTGPYSQLSQKVTTVEGAPSVPRQLQLAVKNETKVFITWLQPAELNGHLGNVLYRITYVPAQTGNASKVIIAAHSLMGSPQNLTLKDLSADTTYIVRVSAGRHRSDGVERWSDNVSDTIRTLQLIPLTPPVDLAVTSSGPYHIIVKWKVPPYSILGYQVWFKEYESRKSYEKVLVPRMESTVYLIKDLQPNTQYRVKVRMYSNAGIGPFSEPRVITTDADAFAVRSGLSDKKESSGLKVAIACFVCGLLLLLLILAFACYKRRQDRLSRHSFYIRDSQDSSLQYVVRGRQDSSVSVGDDSEGSVEGHYNLAQNYDEIDVGMFAGGRNSAHYSQGGDIQYLDPTLLDSPSYIGDARLETYRPRVSPMPLRSNYADLRQTFGNEADEERNPGSDAYSDLTTDNTNKETLNGQSNASAFSKKNPESDNVSSDPVGDSTNEHLMQEDDGPPDWLPPPPPPTELNQFPVYAQVDPTRKKGFSEKDSFDNTNNRPAIDGPAVNGDTSDEEDSSNWLPPPPPPPSVPPGDSDWERPLPPEILALPGKRNRVASWARDESDGNFSNGGVGNTTS